jgi:hypothetical protein
MVCRVRRRRSGGSRARKGLSSGRVSRRARTAGIVSSRVRSSISTLPPTFSVIVRASSRASIRKYDLRRSMTGRYAVALP